MSNDRSIRVTKMNKMIKTATATMKATVRITVKARTLKR